MNMIQRQMELIPYIDIQSTAASRENDDSSITQNIIFHNHIGNFNHRVREYQESI